jgi:spermidine synthase
LASASSSPQRSEAEKGAQAPPAHDWPVPGAAGPRALRPNVLLSMVLVIATAGLVYELVMAAVASYVLGDSVKQFSIVIGVYLSALGLGAYLSRFVTRRLALTFVDVELSAALLGGLSAPGLFLAFSFTNAFPLVLYSIVLLVGVLVGLELPLLIRILRQRLAFEELIAKALTYDYAGALIGSLAFSLLLVPTVGLVHTSLVCGLLNALVGVASTWVLWPEDAQEQRAMRQARVRAIAVTLIVLVAIGLAERVTEVGETALYRGKVLHAEQSRYQRIVLVERAGAVQLFLNNNLQFSSRDEHRYHEALVHPAMAAADRRGRVLIGGGGDGLALREILRWPDVRAVTLVDLDERVTSLARTDARMTELNRNSLDDPRVRVVSADAMVFIADSRETFDVVVLDFPDPSTFSIGKLYSKRLYDNVEKRLAPGSTLVVQSTSPAFARASFWCIDKTVRAAGFHTLPYHVFVPSFGDWGFVLAKLTEFAAPTELPSAPLRYLDSNTLRALFVFPPELSRVETEVNRLNNQALVNYYLREWSRFD